jgi:hypothetical protein
LSPAVGEEREVIHIAKIGSASQLTGHELIERVQIAVGPELRGEAADRQAARPADGEKVVAWEANVAIFIIEDAAAAADDRLHQRHHIRFGDLKPKDVEQDGVIYRRKVLHDVGAQHVSIASGEDLQPIDGPMRPLADTIGA